MGDTVENAQASASGDSSNDADAETSVEGIHFQPQIDSKGRLRTHVCTECGKTFLRAGHLTSHMMLHTGERPYHCSYCPKKFTNTSGLNSHIRQHTGDRPFQCKECGARFAQTSNLKSHMMHHNGQRPYKCSICDKGFIYSTSLNRHMNCHTGDKPYPCTLCPKKFNTSTHLNSHMFVHTREKPYSCPVCDKAFRHRSNMNTHMKLHTKWKGVSCTICMEEFLTWDDLNDHTEKDHEGCGSKDICCPDCKMCFTDMEEFLSHISEHKEPVTISCTDSPFPSLSAHLRKTDAVREVTADKAVNGAKSESPAHFRPKRHSTKRIPSLSELGVASSSHKQNSIAKDGNSQEEGESDTKKSKQENREDSDNDDKSLSESEADNLPYTCPVCKLVFPLSMMLMQHMATHMASVAPSCNSFQLAMFQAFINTPVGQEALATMGGSWPTVSGLPSLLTGDNEPQCKSRSKKLPPQNSQDSEKAPAQDENTADGNHGNHMLNRASKPADASPPSAEAEDYTCDLCKLTFLQQDQLIDHMATHPEVP